MNIGIWITEIYTNYHSFSDLRRGGGLGYHNVIIANV